MLYSILYSFLKVFFLFQVNISMLVRYLLQIAGSLAFMFVLNASLTGVLLAVVPIVAVGAVQYGKDWTFDSCDANAHCMVKVGSYPLLESYILWRGGVL